MARRRSFTRQKVSRRRKRRVTWRTTCTPEHAAGGAGFARSLCGVDWVGRGVRRYYPAHAPGPSSRHALPRSYRVSNSPDEKRVLWKQMIKFWVNTKFEPLCFPLCVCVHSTLLRLAAHTVTVGRSVSMPEDCWRTRVCAACALGTAHALYIVRRIIIIVRQGTHSRHARRHDIVCCAGRCPCPTARARYPEMPASGGLIPLPSHHHSSRGPVARLRLRRVNSAQCTPYNGNNSIAEALLVRACVRVFKSAPGWRGRQHKQGSMAPSQNKIPLTMEQRMPPVCLFPDGWAGGYLSPLRAARARVWKESDF